MPDPRPLPQILARRREDWRVDYRLYLPADLACFQGHFPGFPLLAGVVQIHWAAALFLEEFALPLCFRRMENIKFKRLVVPEMTLELRLDYDPERKRLAFRYRTGEGECSSGRLYWE
ncbi:hypothetical protein MIT9_P0399 [Methylomarinovum caldicuralii]|uniref:ApeI dehydratase-like domain-containing protein n=1 Tax=Methylomarinovum caldicuralii TaxID=438856 RepID=A0AAU9BQ32_9GAMM|nr:AMP-dependent synthetase [Methylomarinovum caldicuralii]BCX80823.1 hypothetical protein MIT9_P0399 [Methylomarinovum caldicuralii]